MSEWASDTDGDGSADTVFVDGNDDGIIDASYCDADGDGVFEIIGVDTSGDGIADQVFLDLDGDGYSQVVGYDTDHDGVFELWRADSDLNGSYELVSHADAAGNGVVTYIDENGDWVADASTAAVAAPAPAGDGGGQTPTLDDIARMQAESVAATPFYPIIGTIVTPSI